MSRSTEEHRAAAPDQVRCAVITVSDTRTEETDGSGRLIQQRLTEQGHTITDYRIVKDEPEQIGKLLDDIAGSGGCDAIILNGGTGIARRDTTYDVVAARLEKRLDGFGELFRALSYPEIGAAAMLTRAVAGVYRDTVIILTPGSTHAVGLALDKLIVPELAHLVYELRK
ncbi:MAG TPA: MogA/MoaB family molybdenum cofactor biosynthesis protein [Thermomicrobiaceae bacterium]|nr:MogA/MoaB family molybdenum cofactor biosynthesis protein [Thermomicrobiaceae bacterium]